MQCNKKHSVLLTAAVALMVCFISAQNSHAEVFEGIEVTFLPAKEQSQGDLLFIPGLNSGSGTFTETCAALNRHYNCHLLHLPGFAGQAPLSKIGDGFLMQMRDSVAAYIAQHKIAKPVVVGHSLGGTLGLMLAIEQPTLISKLIIIDALPFFSAIQNPAATADSIRPQAEQMRSGMMSQGDEQFFSYAAASVASMSNHTERLAQLQTWSRSSDRTTTTTAMFELMTTDLRADIAAIKTPTLVLGSWAAYKPYGATQASTQAIFTQQYSALASVDIRMSATGFHFLTWDDGDWVAKEMLDFLAAKADITNKSK